MLSVENLMKEDLSAYSKEEQIYLKKFREELVIQIKEALIQDIADKMQKSIQEHSEDFMIMLRNLLGFGHKGYENMSPMALLNLYLEVKNEEDFIVLVEKVSENI